jgi:NAD(P)-dependent dehydrogenase (short-subunit alcohol dehydrogenase family)
MLKGKVALVTGAGRGSGQAVALALAQAGARVAVVDVNPDAAQRTVDAITQAGGTAAVHIADVTNKMGVQTMLYAVLEAWQQIDILVNAAHVAPNSSALKLDEWEWDRTLDVNLRGPFLVAQTVARAMQATGGGVILNVLRPAGASPHAAVRAAREGLLGLTAGLAAEWAAINVRVETLPASPDPARTASEAVRICEAAFQHP